jgi:fucose 4-O-acetylase-like acetyltransferase
MKEERFEYLDLMKGVAIIMVVATHVELFVLKTHSFVTLICNLLHNSTFMFVAGFLFYRSNSNETKSGKVYIYEKMKRLIVPFLVMSLIFSAYRHFDLINLFSNNYKYGYWFTFTLFQIVLLTKVIDFLKNNFTSVFIDLLFYFGFYVLILIVFYLEVLPKSLNGILSYQQLVFNYPIFILGLLLRKYRVITDYLENNNVFFTLSILIFISIVIVFTYFSYINLPLNICANVFGVYCIFYLMKQLIRSDLKIIWLPELGKKSLEIYFIHYFFLSTFFVIDFKKNELEGSVFHILTIVIFTIVILVFTVFVVNVLNKSNLLNKLLFGNK